MRILVVPSVGGSNVDSNDDYQELYRLTEDVSLSDVDAYWYVVLPPWVTDGIRSHDKIHYVRMESTRDPDINRLIGFPPFDIATLFARRGGQHVVDACICGCPPFSMYLKRLLSDPKRDDMPVYIREPLRGRSTHWRSTMESAYGMSDCSVLVRSSSDLRNKMSAFSDYVSPSMRRNVMKGSIVWPTGHDLDAYDDIVERSDRKPTLFYGGSFLNKQVSRRVLSLYRSMFVNGVEVSVVSRASKSTTANGFPDSDRSYVSKLIVGAYASEYYKEAAEAGLFISVGTEDSEVGDIEESIRLLLLGQVGIFPNQGLNLSYIPGDYPFLYDAHDNQDALNMALYVANNYKKAKKDIQPYVESIRSRFNRLATNLGLWSEMLGQIKSVRERGKRGALRTKQKSAEFLGTVGKVASSLGDEFQFDVFLDILEENATWLKPWGYKGTVKTIGRIGGLPTQYDIIEALEELGWTDMCNSSDIFMRKK